MAAHPTAVDGKAAQSEDCAVTTMPRETRAVAARMMLALTLSAGGCATGRAGQPHEDQLAAWYHRIQVAEARIDVAKSTLLQPAAQSQRQQAQFAINDAAQRICDAAVLIGEADAELRCELARRHMALSAEDP